MSKWRVVTGVTGTGDVMVKAHELRILEGMLFFTNPDGTNVITFSPHGWVLVEAI